jgi:3-oxoacyl-[acyl-carrier-protein] synthase III
MSNPSAERSTSYLNAVGVLLPRRRPVAPEEVASAPAWRGVCSLPGISPADMAVTAGSATLLRSGIDTHDVAWVVHTGSGYQGANGWPVHHHIANRVIGPHANSFELRQYCAGGLTSWLVGDRLRDTGAALCTGADNWSWADRFAVAREHGGEPLSDAAHAAVLSQRRGFAAVLGTGQASCPGHADLWRTRENHWETTGPEDLRDAFGRAAAQRDASTAEATVAMVTRAATAALGVCGLSPRYVTDFVPHSSASGRLYRNLARALGLPWREALQDHYLEHGYLGTSVASAGLIHLAQSSSLTRDSVVLLLAVEYNVSASAAVLRITNTPRVDVDGAVTVIS